MATIKFGNPKTHDVVTSVSMAGVGFEVFLENASVVQIKLDLAELLQLALQVEERYQEWEKRIAAIANGDDKVRGIARYTAVKADRSHEPLPPLE